MKEMTATADNTAIDNPIPISPIPVVNGAPFDTRVARHGSYPIFGRDLALCNSQNYWLGHSPGEGSRP